MFKHSDINIEKTETVYNGYFSVEKYLFRHRLFSGEWSELVCREIMERGNAAALLPYDVSNDKVVLIEQVRMGAMSSQHSPWLLECVAGVIEQGESPQQVAIRETKEESGLDVTEVMPMLSYLSSPGGTSERLHLYIANVNSELAEGVHGLPEEHEDIKVHVMTREHAMNLLNDGKIENAATVISLQWLQLNLAKVKAAWL
ncbi:ADP-ribose diphosphatase [Flocculibacter collagenilyticus]|uniref:ADP-ribose diphosphatase n=1 Tax=Flocculibacter collagenilyticus TaxID=2744479 RepID=UPI0018F3F807|nr:ADP-ribose diphosphatase [Flocculibacter collagenilyticus]